MAERNRRDIKRRYLGCAIDIGTELEPKFLVHGYKIEESGFEYNFSTETVTDILGDTWHSVDKAEPTQTFDPYRITEDEYGDLGRKLHQYYLEDRLEDYTSFKVILISAFMDEIGKETGYSAVQYDACMILPSSIGGSSYLEAPFTVHYGGEKTKGTVDKLKGLVEFTPEA